jgi:SAM-dependent methyltransferase
VTDAGWDYTAHAQTYADRPGYASSVIDEILGRAQVAQHGNACDIGAGAGHLTIPLLQRGLVVDAVEPNAAMRAIGKRRTDAWSTVRWHGTTAEHTTLDAGTQDLVTFGSSFNVADPALTLPETVRILRPGGWFACIWNHRDLSDPLQTAIEATIQRHLPRYSYGRRRADQSATIAASGLFQSAQYVEGGIVHRVATSSWCAAWQSHATLARQAGDQFPKIVDCIVELVNSRCGDEFEVPYVTRGWLARALTKSAQGTIQYSPNHGPSSGPRPRPFMC